MMVRGRCPRATPSELPRSPGQGVLGASPSVLGGLVVVEAPLEMNTRRVRGWPDPPRAGDPKQANSSAGSSRRPQWLLQRKPRTRAPARCRETLEGRRRQHRGGRVQIVRQSKLRRALMLLGSVAIAIAWMTYSSPPAAADHCSRGQGTLTGPAIDGKVPSGKASWQGTAFCQPLELQVEVSNVNLPDGTTLFVDACASGTTSNIVGSITLRGGAGKLLLSKLDGDSTNDNVPFCDMRFGGSITVSQGSTVVVFGCISNPDIPGAPKC